MIEISRVAEKEPETRDCKNCKHYVKREGIAWGIDSGTYGCESWSCRFEPKEVQDGSYSM